MTTVYYSPEGDPTLHINAVQRPQDQVQINRRSAGPTSSRGEWMGWDGFDFTVAHWSVDFFPLFLFSLSLSRPTAKTQAGHFTGYCTQRGRTS
jgi:hypothetical protein